LLASRHIFGPLRKIENEILNDIRYSSGKTTGVVLDAGDGVSHVVPVFEGFAIKNAMTRIDVAGR
jgi:hypothetical protein